MKLIVGVLGALGLALYFLQNYGRVMEKITTRNWLKIRKGDAPEAIRYRISDEFIESEQKGIETKIEWGLIKDYRISENYLEIDLPLGLIAIPLKAFANEKERSDALLLFERNVPKQPME